MTVLLGIATRLRLARLLLITDLRSATGDLPVLVAEALGGGVDFVQLRDLRAGRDALAEAFLSLRPTVSDRGRLLGLFDVPELAEAVGADVLQLAARGLSAGAARSHLHQRGLIGRSCLSPALVDAALADPEVDYLTVGPVVGGRFGAGGLQVVAHAAAKAPPSDPAAKPWFAVGGITLENLDEVLTAGARRVAVSRAIADADQPGVAAAEFAARLAAVWHDDPGMQQVTLAAMRSPNR